MERFTIESVDIEGLHKVGSKAYNFHDPVSYLHGENGAGKSTVLQAIQLCLLGYIPGTNKTNVAIMGHCGDNQVIPGQNRICVTVNLIAHKEDGTTEDVTVVREFTKNRNKIDMYFGITPDTYTVEDFLGNCKLPLFEWSEFMSLTPNKLKDWFIKFLPSSDDKIDWGKLLKASLTRDLLASRYLVPDYVSRLQKLDFSDQIDWVSKANDLFKKELSLNKALLDRTEKSINTMVSFGDENEGFMTMDDMKLEVQDMQERLEYHKLKSRELLNQYQSDQQAEKQKASVESKIEQLNKYIENIGNVQELKLKVTELKEEIDKLDARIEQDTNTVSDLRDQKSQAAKYLESLKVQLKTLEKVMNCSGYCPFTNEFCEEMSQKKQNSTDEYYELQESIKLKETELQDLTSEVTSVEHNIRKCQNRKQTDSVEIDNINQRLKNRDTMLVTLEQHQQELEAIELPEHPVSLEDVNYENDMVASLGKDIEKMNSHIKCEEQIDSLVAEKNKLCDTIDALKEWIKLTGENGMQTDLMVQPFETMEQELDKYLSLSFGEPVTCRFNVENKANSFSFGLVRGRQYIPYNLLSTGEKTLFAFALMTYLSQNSGSGLHLVMMDDFLDHLDDEKFDSLMKLFNSGDLEGVQVIMAGVKNCTSDSVRVIEV